MSNPIDRKISALVAGCLSVFLLAAGCLRGTATHEQDHAGTHAAPMRPMPDAPVVPTRAGSTPAALHSTSAVNGVVSPAASESLEGIRLVSWPTAQAGAASRAEAASYSDTASAVIVPRQEFPFEPREEDRRLLEDLQAALRSVERKAAARPNAVQAPVQPPVALKLAPSSEPRQVSETPSSERVPSSSEPPALLPEPAGRPVPRSVQLEAAAVEADRLSRRGYELAGRKALFAARLQFVEALHVLADALDREAGTRKHAKSLAAALAALDEAEDFLPEPGRFTDLDDLEIIIGAHQTRVLKEASLDGLTPLDAFRQYLTFAQEQLASATSGEVAGSMALRGLGKVYVALADDPTRITRAPEAKAMTLYQAALMAWPENYMAANDLGVLLARGGRWNEARAVLERSVAIRPSAAALRNLAYVYGKLGSERLASAAIRQCGLLEPVGARLHAVADAVMWVPPERFLGVADRPLLPRPGGALMETPHAEPSFVGQAKPSSASRTTESEFWPSLSFTGLFKGKATKASSGEREVRAGRPDAAALRTQPTPAPATASIPAEEPLPARPDSARPSAVTTSFPGCNTCGRATNPASPCARCAVDCSVCDWTRRGGWERARVIAWEKYAQGEYVGEARTAHVDEYRLRVDDQLELIYRLTREETGRPYRLNVGDRIRIESVADPALTRELIIQPDGTITLRLLGQVKVTGMTVDQLRQKLDQLYTKYYKVPAITVTPLVVNSKLEDLRSAVDRRSGVGGQSQAVTITPEGTIALPAIGTVYAQGLTLRELQDEINERYRQEIDGVEVIPVLVQRAPRYIYVLGEVGAPGRYELTGPTTVLQALAMAGSWNNGAHLHQIVVFRRGPDWRLMATMLDLHAVLHGKKACPADEIWLADSDVIIVPKSPILVADDFIELVFTRGIYGVFPLTANINFAKLSSI
ncbi:polysaccharide biosynthesis/export family protein [Thermostilla marina]